MHNNKRGTVTPERVAMDEEAKRLKAAARYLGEEKRRQHRLARRVRCACLTIIVALGMVGCWVRSAPERMRADIHKAPPVAWATDGEQDTGGPIARPMPAKPFEGQKKPPCTPHRQVAINDGCWVELAAKPLDDQCGDDGYAHGGRCYIPVKQAKRPPVGLEP